MSAQDPRMKNMQVINEDDTSHFSSLTSSINDTLKYTLQLPCKLLKHLTHYKIFLSLCVFTIILLGSLFYHLYNGWDIITSLFYQVQVFMGCAYGEPNTEHNWGSKMFTLMMHISGNILCSGIYGLYVSSTVNEWFSQSQASISLYHKLSIGMTMLMIIALIGFIYGTFFELWSWKDSVYFAFSALAGFGNTKCIAVEGKDPLTQCSIGLQRGVFLVFYMIISIPIYNYILAQLGIFIMEISMKKEELRRCCQPIKESELQGVLDTLESKDSSIFLAEFLILELIRLQRLKHDEAEKIKRLFHFIDKEKNGYICREDLQKSHMYYIDIIQLKIVN